MKTLNDMAPGFYVLTKDVLVPGKFRWKARTYLKGTYLHVEEDSSSPKKTVLVFTNGNNYNIEFNEEQVSCLLPFMEVAVPAIGQFINCDNQEAQVVLALLVEKGIVTFEQVKEIWMEWKFIDSSIGEEALTNQWM